MAQSFISSFKAIEKEKVVLGNPNGDNLSKGKQQKFWLAAVSSKLQLKVTPWLTKHPITFEIKKKLEFTYVLYTYIGVLNHLFFG